MAAKGFAAGFMRHTAFAMVALLALAAGAHAVDGLDLQHLRATNACYRCDLSEAELGQADLSGADLRRANLIRAELRGADLRGADLGVADLRGAALIGADLREADLSRADLRVTDLSGADLQGASELTQQQISSACSNPEAPPRLSGGLEPPPSCPQSK